MGAREQITLMNVPSSTEKSALGPRLQAERSHMRGAASVFAGLIFISASWTSHAQIPAVIGTWKLNVESSKVAGSAPQIQVRSYRLTSQGVLIGVVVTGALLAAL
jgi:hypothetical protein